MTLSNTLIGDAYTSTITWDILEELTDIGNRMAGQHGEQRGASFLANTFSEHGLREVETNEFTVPGWWRDSSSLSVSSDPVLKYDDPHEVIALAGSPSATITEKLVDVGCGLPEDFESLDVSDRLVLVSSKTPNNYGRWVHRTEKYALAVEAGASGFLFYNEIPGCLPLTGNIGNDGPGTIPAVGLSREVGHKLVSACERNSPETTLEVVAQNAESTSQNVEAVIGPKTEEEILLTAHVDAHDIADGATDNGVGCALVAEIGRLLSQVENDLDTAVRFVIFGAEEIGLRGSHEWTASHDMERVKCIVNIDGNGVWEDVTMYTHGFEELKDAFHDHNGILPSMLEIDSGYLPHSDHWPFVQRGVPGAMIRSESKTGRGWGHTHADTLDKLDHEPLCRLVVVVTFGILSLADRTVEIDHASPSEVRDDLIENGHAPGLKAGGSWPFDEE